MCTSVRTQVLTAINPNRRRLPPQNTTQLAGLRLLETYAGLAQRGQHLLGQLLGSELPRQWQHYPADDAIDVKRAYQWFYHSHAPEDRPDAGEHGHLHLFARRKLWVHRLRSAAEIEWASLEGEVSQHVKTRHLLSIGLNAKGLPTSLFTVNSWVTGDLMLSASNTSLLLENMRLDTGYETVDAVIESVITLYAAEIRQLLIKRDALLFQNKAPGILYDERFEILSEMAIDLDVKLMSVDV